MINLSDNNEFRVKWICANFPYVEFDVGGDEKRFHLTKRDIVAIRDELTSFIEFYKEDFSPEQIDWTHDDA